MLRDSRVMLEEEPPVGVDQEGSAPFVVGFLDPEVVV